MKVFWRMKHLWDVVSSLVGMSREAGMGSINKRVGCIGQSEGREEPLIIFIVLFFYCVYFSISYIY
jgi:hypothetical protein